MNVLETKLGGYSAPNIGYVRRLYLLDREQCVAVLDPVRYRYAGALLGVIPYGGIVTHAGAELTRMVFPPKSCTMAVSYSGKTVDFRLSYDLPGQDVAILNFFMQASLRQYVCLVEDNNGRAFVIGNEERGLRLTLVQNTAGLSVSQLSLAGRLNVPPFQLLGLVLADLFADTDISFGFQLNFISTSNTMYKYVVRNILNVRRGDSFEFNNLITGDVDLTGVTLLAQVRRYPDDYVVVLSLDAEIDGQYVMLSKTAQEMTLPAGTYYYDVQFTFPDGGVYTLYGGAFQVLSDISA